MFVLPESSRQHVDSGRKRARNFRFPCPGNFPREILSTSSNARTVARMTHDVNLPPRALRPQPVNQFILPFPRPRQSKMCARLWRRVQCHSPAPRPLPLSPDTSSGTPDAGGIRSRPGGGTLCTPELSRETGHELLPINHLRASRRPPWCAMRANCNEYAVTPDGELI